MAFQIRYYEGEEEVIRPSVYDGVEPESNHYQHVEPPCAETLIEWSETEGIE